jgi:hypothetical protein
MPIDYNIYSGTVFTRENLTFNSGGYKLTDISSIILSNLVTTIGDNCFEGLTNLTKIQFGTNLQSIGANCFANSGLQTIVYNGIEYNDSTSFANVFGIQRIGLNAFSGTNF